MTKIFGAKSSTNEVLEGVALNGKRYLVTGVSSGIGVETARALVAHGAEVIGTARDVAKARAATDKAGFDLDVIQLDLADMANVRSASDKLLADGRTFDGIIANAGVMATPFGHTVDGFETQFGTNHLGHFVFVNRIASLIRDNGRMVTVSSNGHRWANVDLVDPNFESRPYDPWISYGNSKTAVILFAVEFDRRHRGRGIRATSLMPGVSHTNLAQHLSQEDSQRLASGLRRNLRPQARRSSSRPFRRSSPPPSGLLSWPTAMRLEVTTARIARWHQSTMLPASASASCHMRSIPTKPSCFGLLAKNSWASGSDADGVDRRLLEYGLEFQRRGDQRTAYVRFGPKEDPAP
jgi:NAD(P)-dependent dehydrogenase (short-subunit alcohol dehydrogenase family)